MSRFIKKCLLFIFLIWLLSMPIYIAGEYLYLKEYKKNNLTFRSYLLADSHGLSLSSILEEYGIYNFSAGSESYYDMKRKLNFLIENTRVDTIYITINDHTLSSYREISNNLDRSVYYSTKQDYNNYYLFLKDKIYSKVSLLQPKKREIIFEYVISNYSNLIMLNKHNNKKEIKEWHELSKDEKNRLALNRFQTHFNEKNTSDNLYKELCEIVEICKRENIILIGVLFPLSQEYLDLLGNDKENKSIDMFNKEGITVLDFREEFMKNSNLFYNQDHLNSKGGQLLAKMIINMSR